MCCFAFSKQIVRPLCPLFHHLYFCHYCPIHLDNSGHTADSVLHFPQKSGTQFFLLWCLVRSSFISSTQDMTLFQPVFINHFFCQWDCRVLSTFTFTVWVSFHLLILMCNFANVLCDSDSPPSRSLFSPIMQYGVCKLTVIDARLDLCLEATHHFKNALSSDL